MKFLAFVVIFVHCAHQLYFVGALDQQLTNKNVHDVRVGLEGMPEIETKEVELIMNYLENHRENPNRLLTIAMQGNTCRENAIDLKHIVGIGLNQETDESHHDSTIDIKHYDDNQFGLIEADLNKTQTPERVQHSMKILRIIKDGMMNNKRFGPELVDLYKLQAKALSNGCPSEDQ